MVARKFGYKTKMMRLSLTSKYVMELLVPSLVKSCMKKIRHHSIEHGYPVKKMLHPPCCHDAKKPCVKENKILKALKDEPFETDDSMKEITLADFVSDGHMSDQSTLSNEFADL